MLCTKILIWILLTDISLATPIRTNEIDHSHPTLIEPSIEKENSTLDVCSVNIDQTNPHHRVLTNLSTIDFLSSWEQQIVQHATALNIIQITFIIPYNLSNQTILNKTILILDVPHRHLLASISDICFNQSSFFVNYSTLQPLPHDVCLYLLLNLTSTMNLKEIIFCRTIEHIPSENITSSKHPVGPSEFFILSQCIIIFIMMLIIFSVQTAREKNFLNRVSERVVHTRAFIAVFGSKAAMERSHPSTGVNSISHPATTLQAGLRQLVLNRHVAFVPPPIEEQVLAATDLTSTINDRRVTRQSINRDLIPIKELTKRISVAPEHSMDGEFHQN